jgi:hypothetical protein
MADSTDYDWTDEAAKRLARKRQLARLLQEQAMKGMPMPDRTPVSALAPIAQMFQAYMGQRAEDQAAEEGKAQEAARQKAENDAWAAMQAGRAATPALPSRPDMNLPGDLRDLAGQDYPEPPQAPPPSPLAAGMVQDQQQAPPMGAPPAPQVADPMRNPMAQLLAGKPPETPTLGDTMAADQANAPGPPLVPQLGAGQAPAEPGIVPKPVDLGKLEVIGKREAPAPAIGPVGSDVEAAIEKKYGLEPGLLNMHVVLENSPNDSVSPKGARGKYQIEPTNVAVYSKRAGRQLDPTKEAEGADMAAQVALDAKRRYPNNMEARVAYYNGGPAAGDATAAGKFYSKETDGYLDRYRQQVALKMPPQGSTPAPTLAGPAVPGAIEPPAGDMTDEQWNAMADSTGGAYPASLPAPTLVPRPPEEAVAPPPQPGLPQFLPNGARNMAPEGLQLPAQEATARKPLTIEDMVNYANSLPPGQLKNYVQREAMKAAITEPEKLEAKRQHDETMAALRGRQIESTAATATANREAANQRAKDRNASARELTEMRLGAGAQGYGKEYDKLSPSQQAIVDTYAKLKIGGDDKALTGLGRAAGGAALMKAVAERVPSMMTELDLQPGDMGTARAVRAANQAGLTAITKDLTALKPYSEMLHQNGAILKDLAAKVGNTDSTLLNKPLNWLEQNAESNPDLREYLAQVHIVQAEAARVIKNPRLVGQMHVEDQKAMEQILNGNLPLADTVRIIDRLTNDGDRRLVLMEAQRQAHVDSIKGLTPGSGGSTASPFAPAAPAAATGAPAVAPAAAPPKVSSDAEYNALPSGTVFVGPDGKQRRKP